MRRLIILFVSLTFMTALLLGCQRTEGDDLSSEANLSAYLEKTSLVDGTIKSIRVSKLNDKHAIAVEEKEKLEAFQRLLSSATKSEGIVNMDMEGRDYDVEIDYENNNYMSLYIWIGDKGQKSTVMRVDDTHTVYIVSEEGTGSWIEFMEAINMKL
ncbi:hypothetical protein ACFQZE_12370 [Paenibacillus sp. GCM10027627]|uniref:hypothetical protein n=1 Tax=unclassified Paenibacillus TaxID=185978 RepID=UPI0036284722